MRTPALIKVEIYKNKCESMYRTIEIFRQKKKPTQFSIHTTFDTHILTECISIECVILNVIRL